MSASVTQRGAVIVSPLPSIAKPIVRRAERLSLYSSARPSSASVRRRERSASGGVADEAGGAAGGEAGDGEAAGPSEERQVELAVIESHDGRPWPGTLRHQFASFGSAQWVKLA
ncbi:hypothetical protein X985_547 [Burkholderia pseudomallei MSHR4012]|nr:hypothetical protein X985_547 [Burkholderia pseudomallei MSHR4012]